MRESDKKDVVVYNGSGNLRIEVLADANTVWLNRQQLALMFGRDIKTIGKHIANALKEELKGVPTVAKFATVQKEGGSRTTSSASPTPSRRFAMCSTRCSRRSRSVGPSAFMSSTTNPFCIH